MNSDFENVTSRTYWFVIKEMANNLSSVNWNPNESDDVRGLNTFARQGCSFQVSISLHRLYIILWYSSHKVTFLWTFEYSVTTQIFFLKCFERDISKDWKFFGFSHHACFQRAGLELLVHVFRVDGQFDTDIAPFGHIQRRHHTSDQLARGEELGRRDEFLYTNKQIENHGNKSK